MALIERVPHGSMRLKSLENSRVVVFKNQTVRWTKWLAFQFELRIGRARFSARQDGRFCFYRLRVFV